MDTLTDLQTIDKQSWERRILEKDLKYMMCERRVAFISEPGYYKHPDEENYGQYIRLGGVEGKWEEIKTIQEQLIYTAALSFWQLKRDKGAVKILRFEMDCRPFYRFSGTDRASWTMCYILTTNKL